MHRQNQQRHLIILHAAVKKKIFTVNKLETNNVRSVPYVQISRDYTFFLLLLLLYAITQTLALDRWAMIRCPSSQIVIPSNKEAVRLVSVPGPAGLLPLPQHGLCNDHICAAVRA